MNIAEELFNAQHGISKAEYELDEALIEILTEEQLENYGYTTWDMYDSSLEIMDASNKFQLSKEQVDKILNLGFMQLYVCYGTREQNNKKDSTYSEKFYYKGKKENE